MSFPVMSAPNPRKRPAPGASPMVTMTPLQQPYSPNQPDRVIGGWTGAADGGPGFVEPPPPNVNSFTMMSPPGTYGPPAASTALARRPPQRALVHPQFDPEAWSAFAENNNSYLQPQADNMSENEGIETIERLEERALRAKKEAQAKRKQIPPFVQKLSRYGLFSPLSRA
jgi:heat shock transcription factor